MRRPAFTERFGGLSNEQFVDALIAGSGVAVSPAERDAWVAALGAGSERYYVLRQLVERKEFVQAEFAPAFVMMQYMGYLRRDPDASGYGFWLNKLNEFGGDYIRAEMVKAFLESTEYNRRFEDR